MNTHELPFPTGQDFLDEGYTHDSLGYPLDPGAPYDWKGQRFAGADKIWRRGLREPVECVPLNPKKPCATR